MDITRCRHTFTQERMFNPWKRCSFCLESVGPFASVRRCTTCNTVIHAHCYERILQQLHRVAAIMEGDDQGAVPRVTASASDSSSRTTPAVNGPSKASNTTTTTTNATLNSVMNAYSSFADYAAAQRASLLSTNTKPAATTEHSEGSDAAPPSSPSGASTWWSALFTTPSRSPTTTAPSGAPRQLSAVEVMAPHVHQLEPFNVYVPFRRCVICTRAGAAKGTHSVSADDEEEMETQPVATTPTSTPSRTPAAAAAAFDPHYDAVQKLLREGGWLGLGMSGYRCTTCEGAFELHMDCLRRVSHDSYTLKAPPAQRMAGMDSGEADGKSSADQGASTASDVAAALAAKSLPDWVKLLLHAYLTASSAKAQANLNEDGERGGGEKNVDRILNSLYAYMGMILDEFPNLGRQLLNPIRMRKLNREHDTLYEACCVALPDADIFGRVVATDTASPLGSPVEARGTPASGPPLSPRSTTIDLQQHPTTLFLRDTMRFAMAVYGECYRDGSLSSLFSSALLFTTNKDDVYRMPKETNDKAVTDVLTLPRSALKLSRWTSHPGEASYALLVDHGSHRIVVAFRGTLSEVDILTDVCAFGEPFCGGVAHQGAARAVNLLFDNRASRLAAPTADEAKQATAPVATGESTSHDEPSSTPADTVVISEQSTLGAINSPPSPPAAVTTTSSASSGEDRGSPPPALVSHEDGFFSAPQLTQRPDAEPDALLDMLEDLALRKFPSYDVVITGHSLGAGEAILLGVRLVHDGVLPADVLAKRVHVVAFAPMPTLSLPAATLCDEPAAPLTAADKTAAPPMPALACMWSIVNACDVVPRLQINSLNRLCALLCAPEEESRETAATEGVTKGSAVAHDEKTADEATKPRRKSLDLMPELHHPGRVFVFTNPGDPMKNRLVEVPRGHLMTHEIFVTQTMLTAHLIDNYMDAMRYVRTREVPVLLPNPAAADDPPKASTQSPTLNSHEL